MKMNRHASRVPALAAAGLLTACGGGGNDGDPAHFSGRNDSMASRISDARTLEEATTFRAETVGLTHPPGLLAENVPPGAGEAGSGLADRKDIAFRIFRTSPDAVPTFVVTYSGETTTFGPEHWAPNTYFNEGSGDTDYKALWSYGGNLLEHADGRYWGDWTEGRYIPMDWKYHVPVTIYFGGDEADQDLFAVIGLETAPGDMPTHDVRARYRGGAWLDVPATGGNGETQHLDGDVTLIADFSEGTIEGTLDDFRTRIVSLNLSADRGNRVVYGPWEGRPGLSYTVAATAISGNGFTTSMAPGPDCSGCVGIVDSTVSGKFYGPYAEETGGTIQAEFSDGTVGAGVFYTNQN